MLPGEPTIEHDSPTLMYRFSGIAAPVDGLWYPAVKKGDLITKGQLVGEMCDFFGNPLTRSFVLALTINR